MSRIITGKLRHFVNNEPLANTPITFRLRTDVAVEPGEAFPVGEHTVTTNATGDIPAGFALAVPPTGAWRYSCKISGNRAFDFYLEAGAAMTIDDIVALAGIAGAEPSPSFTPDPHAPSHAAIGSDPLTPAAIGAEVAGATATHAALTGDAVHGLGTMSTATETDYLLASGTRTGATSAAQKFTNRVETDDILYARNAATFLPAGNQIEQVRFGRADNDIRYHSIFTGAHAAVSADEHIAFFVHTGATTTSQIEVMRVTGRRRVTIGAHQQIATALLIKPDVATDAGQIIQLAATPTANAQEIRNSADAVLSATRPDGSWQPPQIADAAAANNSLYYSTTLSKLVFKDPAGVVNALY